MVGVLLGYGVFRINTVHMLLSCLRYSRLRFEFAPGLRYQLLLIGDRNTGFLLVADSSFIFFRACKNNTIQMFDIKDLPAASRNCEH